MLTENDVIDAVARHLTAIGWRIDQRLTTMQTGIDLVAYHSGTSRRLLLEAKGGTSSKDHTERYGLPFTGNQARSHVAVALYCAVKMIGEHPEDVVALAFPDDANHRLRIEPIAKGLDTLCIRTFFVAIGGAVSMIGPPL